MLIQPLNDKIFERPLPEGLFLDLRGIRCLPFASPDDVCLDNATLLSDYKRCHELVLGFADLANQRSGDCGRPGSENKAVARRLDRRADPSEVVEQIFGTAHISAFAPGVRRLQVHRA
jgi:hypothetical protein